MLFSFFALIPSRTHAVDLFKDTKTCQSGQPEYNTDFCKNVRTENSKRIESGTNSIFVKILQIVVFATAAISVIMIVIGGFRYVVSSGDSNAVSGAKNTILYALIGLVVAIFAQAIISFVLVKFL